MSNKFNRHLTSERLKEIQSYADFTDKVLPALGITNIKKKILEFGDNHRIFAKWGNQVSQIIK